MAIWTEGILTQRNRPHPGNFGIHFRAGQNAALTRLGALTEFYFKHLHLLVSRNFPQAFGAQTTVGITHTVFCSANLEN